VARRRTAARRCEQPVLGTDCGTIRAECYHQPHAGQPRGGASNPGGYHGVLHWSVGPVTPAAATAYSIGARDR